ncbi:hypothetical protein FOCG_17415 [Fusarium oxysporum f. sp. radicis-lycopersici 26381]|nr:hypothetical protein FOCG_17415 [Fusarium oxysporum f. sp. radicis-lycopersici 26381]
METNSPTTDSALKSPALPYSRLDELAAWLGSMSLAILLLGNIHRSSWDLEDTLDWLAVTLMLSSLITSVVAVVATKVLLFSLVYGQAPRGQDMTWIPLMLVGVAAMEFVLGILFWASCVPLPSAYNTIDVQTIVFVPSIFVIAGWTGKYLGVLKSH